MIVRETSMGPTPAGGIRSDIVYMDNQGRPVDKSKATKAIIREFDREGRIVRETFGFIGRATRCRNRRKGNFCKGNRQVDGENL